MNRKHNIGRAVNSIEHYDTIGPITGIALLIDDNTEYVAGDMTGYVFEVVCPYGTQDMANNLLVDLQGKTYSGFRAVDAVLSVDAELGDGVIVDGSYVMLAYQEITFGPKHTSVISAPGESTLEHEYPYTGSTQKSINRQIAKVNSRITKTKEEILLEVIDEINGLSSSIDQKLDSITIRVVGEGGVVSEIKLLDEGKIDLTGYATFSGLANGTTVIDGGCIKADSKIESPIIVGGEIYAGTPENMLGYLKMVSDGLEVYNKDGLVKARIGYTSADLDYPYIQLGSGNSSGVNSQGIVKKFVDGLWVGNGAALEASGNFSPQEGYHGIFVKFSDGQTYVVRDTSMQNVYTGDSIARFG